MADQPTRPTLEMLDQLFANHFGVRPMMSPSVGNGQALSSFSSNSSSTTNSARQTKATSISSRSSNESGSSPKTPANLPLELFQSNADPFKQFDDAQDDARPKNAIDGDRMVKVNSLLQALAELYASPQSSDVDRAQTQARAATPGAVAPLSIAPKSDKRQEKVQSIYCDANEDEGVEILRGARADEVEVSPKTVERSLPLSDGNGEEATIWPADRTSVHEVAKPEDVGIVSARRPSRMSVHDVRPMGPLTQIHYKLETLPRSAQSDDEYRNELVRNFPQLCDAPHAIMFDDQGVALPPLKYEETTDEERKARKGALAIRVRGKKMHTLIKSMVVVESRSAHWKKVGGQASSKNLADAAASPQVKPYHARTSSREATPRLPELPSPWNMNFLHSDEDTLSITGTARRTFELSESRAYGQCPKCEGNGQEACTTCKGSPPDECFWCDGSGREKRNKAQKCNPCTGTGKLVCRTCDGSLHSACRTCSGEGRGEFCAYVQIKVRRVDFTPVPVANIIASGMAYDGEAVRAAATERTWDVINQLTEASKVKHKHPFRPLAASCSCQTSWSDLVEVDVPQAAKGIKHSASSSSSPHSLLLKRSRSLNNIRAARDAMLKKAPTKRRFFVLPSDKDLQPAEIDEDEFELALIPTASAANSRPTSSQATSVASATPRSEPVKRLAPASRAIAMTHQRSQSERVTNGADVLAAVNDERGSVRHPGSTHRNLSPGTRSPPRGHHPSDVAAWQAELQRRLYERPVSPTSTAAEMTPKETMSRSAAPGYFNNYMLPPQTTPVVLAQRNGFDTPASEVPPSHFTASPKPAPLSAFELATGGLQMQLNPESPRSTTVQHRRRPMETSSASSSVSGHGSHGHARARPAYQRQYSPSRQPAIPMSSYGNAF